MTTYRLTASGGILVGHEEGTEIVLSTKVFPEFEKIDGEETFTIPCENADLNKLQSQVFLRTEHYYDSNTETFTTIERV